MPRDDFDAPWDSQARSPADELLARTPEDHLRMAAALTFEPKGRNDRQQLINNHLLWAIAKRLDR